MKKIKLLFPILVLLIISCKNDNCDMPLIGESFTISESISIHLSNYFESEKVFGVPHNNGH